MEIKEILTSSKMKTIYWQLGNGLVVLAIMYITDIDWVYAPIVLPLLNTLTKYINQELLTESDTTM